MFWYTLIKTSELSALVEETQKDIYFLATSFDKRFTDKELRKTLPKGVTDDIIKEFIIDRKQNKIVIILKP
jgi:hypothetical protein